MIGLIDYDSGNLQSVRNALQHLGAEARLFRAPEGLDSCRALVLPGVGAFGDAVGNLRAQGLWGPLRDWIGAGKPFLGICVGYQLLFEASDESPGIEGLGVLPGRVARFPDGALKVPHMGWNSLRVARPGEGLFAGLPPDPYVYFVHSYFPVPADGSIVSAPADYGGPFAAAVSSGALDAVQFHPEKSQENGLRILRNFLQRP